MICIPDHNVFLSLFFKIHVELLSIYYGYYVLLYMVCVSVPMHVPLYVHGSQAITGVGSLLQTMWVLAIEFR